MIRAHFFHSQEDALSSLTAQLFKHIESTRFIIDPHHSCDDFSYQGVFLHHEGVQFSLALSGGEAGKKIFSFWNKHYLKDAKWSNIDFYWLSENLVPYNSPESNIGEAFRLFFQHSNVAWERIHPIRYNNVPEEEAKRYTSQLPSSRGISYDPTRYYTNQQECVIPYKSNFHCAIIDIESDGQIASVLPTSPEPSEGSKYHLITHPQSGQKEIAASIEILRQTPRILVPLLGKEKAQIIDDLYHLRNTHQPAIQLLLEHPNVHIFTDNTELETTIYPNRRYVQTTPDVIRL